MEMTREVLSASSQALGLARPPARASSCPSTCLVHLINCIMFWGESGMRNYLLGPYGQSTCSPNHEIGLPLLF